MPECSKCGILYGLTRGGTEFPPHNPADCEEFQKIKARMPWRCSMCLKPLDPGPDWKGGSLYCSHSCAYA